MSLIGSSKENIVQNSHNNCSKKVINYIMNINYSEIINKFIYIFFDWPFFTQ